MHYEAVAEGTHNGVYSVTVHARCIECKKLSILIIPENEWLAWTQHDQLIQNAMPSVPVENRELLISGICGTCFDAIFADDEEEEEEQP